MLYPLPKVTLLFSETEPPHVTLSTPFPHQLTHNGEEEKGKREKINIYYHTKRATMVDKG